MSNSNNLTYFKSKDVRVFPCAYRGFKPTTSTDALDANPVVWNADASLTTEYNLTHMFSHLLGRQSFIISSPEHNNNADFKCVINGYYFEIAREAFCGICENGKWLDTLRGERDGCLCIRLLPKFEKGANGETRDPATADFNLTSLITLELTQTSEGYLLDNESTEEFTGLAYCPNASTFSNLSAMPTDGSVLYNLPLNDESLYAETVYQEIKEKIIEGVKAVNWSKHLEVAPLSIGLDSTINLDSYSGISNLHTFYVGDLKTLRSSGLRGMVKFPPALGSALSETTSPDLFLALEVFDPGIGSTSSPKTSPIIQILHTFGYSKAKIAVEYTPEKAQTVNELAAWMKTHGITVAGKTASDPGYYTKTFGSDCCTFIRYGNRDGGAETAWGPWEGLSEEELKLFACVRAVEAEKRLADDLIFGNTIPRFAERLKANIHKNQGQPISADLNPGWYCYLQPTVSALALLGGQYGLDSTVSWEQKQLLGQTSAHTYTVLLEVMGDDNLVNSPRIQRASIVNSSNVVIASCSRAAMPSSGTAEKWIFDITSTNIQDQFVARADKQKVHQISNYAGLKDLIKTLYEHSVRDTQVSRRSLQVELQFTNSSLDLEVPSYPLGYNFHLVPGTIGYLTTCWTASGVCQISLELRKPNGTSFSQILSADLKVSTKQSLESALTSLRWKVQYPANVQNPIPLSSYNDLIRLQVQLLGEMPFGQHKAEAVSLENNLSVPVVIANSFTMEEVIEPFDKHAEIPRGSIGYLAILADQEIPENRDEYGTDSDWSEPFMFTLNLLTPWGESIIARYYHGRICNGARENTWEISGGHVAEADHAGYAEVAGSVAGTAVSGTVQLAQRANIANRAERVYGKDVSGAVQSATNAGTASKAKRLVLNSSNASAAEDTDTGIGDSLLGSTVTARVEDPGLYLVEVVVKDALGLNAYRDSTFFFIPECSDQQAPRTKQILCGGVVTLDTTYYYLPSTRDDYWHLNTVAFEALAPHGISGSLTLDLAIKVWRIADAEGKANGPFQNN